MAGGGGRGGGRGGGVGAVEGGSSNETDSVCRLFFLLNCPLG